MKAWKLLAQRIVYQNTYRRMYRRRYSLPNGRRGDFYIVERGRVICALVLTPDRRVVIAKQFRPGPGRVLWELVGGRIEHGETPRQAAIRETREETGYHGRVRYLGRSTNDAWSNLERHHFLITQAKVVGVVEPDAFEDIEVTTVSIRQLRQLIRRGQMTDAETAYRALEALGV